jgi:citrate lyase subunit beta / citryl-CoA lyase
VKVPLSYLFVPATRPDRFAKALAAGADAVIIDLEDAVAAPDKDAARNAVLTWARAASSIDPRVLLRINDVSTTWFDADLALARECAITKVLLPKAEQPMHVERARAGLPAGGLVIPMIESARGLLNVDAVAAARGVQRLAFGTLDYAFDMDLSGDERGLAYPACRLALASKATGLAPPIAGITTDLDNEAALLADIAFMRACGLGAKLCIHPKQIATLHRAFAPSEEEISWARRVVAAADEGRGVAQIDGKMVDRPVILKAQNILDRASA